MNATLPSTTIQPSTYAELTETNRGSASNTFRRDHEPGTPPAWESLTGKLYRFHSFRVVDLDDQAVGLVDWIWSDPTTGQGEFLGVQLRWLRGTARAIPAHDVQIDPESSAVRVAYHREQIKRAPRFSIDREISADQKRDIYAHYRPAATGVSGLSAVADLAA
jgi:hypothetical protein